MQVGLQKEIYKSDNANKHVLL